MRQLPPTSGLQPLRGSVVPCKANVKVLGGDSICERAISHEKRQLRRVNLLGRSSPRMLHMDVLASRRLLRSAGFCTVLSSLATYLNARAGHCLQWLRTTRGCSSKKGIAIRSHLHVAMSPNLVMFRDARASARARARTYRNLGWAPGHQTTSLNPKP